MAFKHTAAHPGFKAVEAKIGKEKGIRNPGAVLAAASRNATAGAKRRNPRLNRVGGSSLIHKAVEASAKKGGRR